MKLGKLLGALGDRVGAADPGALRRRHAARAASAALTAWLVMRLANAALADQPMPAVSLFAVTVCFICALVIVDARRVDRRLTLALCVVMFALTAVLASLLGPLSWLYPIILLALIFLSYAARRRGLRPGELALVLTMGLYFAENSRVTWGNLAWFLLATLTGVASIWLWQFVILPYDPVRSLRESTRAFYDRAASIVDAISTGLQDSPAPVDQASWEKDLQTLLKQAKLSRRAIESQFPGVLAPGGWTEDRIGQLQVSLYASEQGLAQMIEGAGDRAHLSGIADEIRVPLARSLRSLCEALRTNSAANVQALASENAALQARVRAYAGAALDAGHADLGAPLSPWVVATLRLISGSVQVAQSIDQVRSLAAQAYDTRQADEMRREVAEKQNRPPLPPPPPPVTVWGRLRVHPTTALGIQAVMATGLAMLLARGLNVDHSNWVFWTAFVVIAGTTGESLRKMMLRVVGTVAGATIGVALALVTPNDTLLVVLVASACIFLTIYFSPISYPQMVFWLNIGFVMVYTRLGAQELDLLVARPFTALMGALVAALVVVFVFPIRMTDRFKAAAARFLDAVDGFVAAFAGAVTSGEDARRLEVAQVKAATTYAQVEQTLPGVAFENNPLVQAQSPLTQQATRLAALDAEVARLARAATEHLNTAGDTGDANLIRAVQERIHRDTHASIAMLRGETIQRITEAVNEPESATAASSAVRSWALAQGRLGDPPESAETRPGYLRTEGGLALIRIQGIVGQLAADLAAAGRPRSIQRSTKNL